MPLHRYYKDREQAVAFVAQMGEEGSKASIAPTPYKGQWEVEWTPVKGSFHQGTWTRPHVRRVHKKVP